MAKLRKLAAFRPLAIFGLLAYAALNVFGGDAVTFWAVYWFAWFFLAFLPPELYWVFNGPKNTLSDNTWRFESLDFKHPFDFSEWTGVHWAFAIVFTLLMSWLWLHLLFGKLR